MDEYKALVTKYMDEADAKLSEYPYVPLIAEKTKVRPAYIASGLSLATFLFVFYRIGARPVTNIIGFVYPLYASFLALRSPSKEDDAQWLTYWMVYGTFTLVESLSDALLYWIPMYHIWKIAFLVWCFLPSTRGSQYIYERLIVPILVKYESSIDSAGNLTKRELGGFANEIKDDVAAVVREQSGVIRRKIIEQVVEGAMGSSSSNIAPIAATSAAPPAMPPAAPDHQSSASFSAQASAVPMAPGAPSDAGAGAPGGPNDE